MRTLIEGAKALGLHLTAKQIEAFDILARELETWNQRFNLTTVRGNREVQTKHLLDSLTCLLALTPADAPTEDIPDTVPVQRASDAPRCVDVGTGAGFPGLPIKIMLPDAHMTLIEATGKKTAFLRHVVSEIGLDGVEIIHDRAETVAHLPEHRERYDFVFSRAVAHMRCLSEYCLPFCRIGGRMVAPKGEDALIEAQEAQYAFETLGGRLLATKEITLSELRAGKYLVVVAKTRRTPERYPRRPGIPSKRPL